MPQNEALETAANLPFSGKVRARPAVSRAGIEMAPGNRSDIACEFHPLSEKQRRKLRKYFLAILGSTTRHLTLDDR